MSEQIQKITVGSGGIEGDVSIDSFWGGEVRGRCLQFTWQAADRASFFQLTESQAKELMQAIDRWLRRE